ncbi:MAG: cation:proton antiporter, partial [Candidatus Micrarchaeota archaeon]
GVATTTMLGEIGVTMLLFYLGLELSVKHFKESGAIATVLAFVEMLFAFVAGFVIAKLFGFATIESIVIGAMLTATSTVVTGKFILDRNLSQTPEARITFSVLVLEDIFAVLVLVLINSLVAQKTLNLLAFNGIVFVIALFFIVSAVSKHVLRFLGNMGYESQMWLYGVGIFLVVSYFGSNYVGIPPAIGAYFAGFALSESAYGERIKRDLGVFKEFFILFFFVSFGATASLPSNPMIYAMLAVLAAGYMLAKLVAHGITGTAIGLDAKSAVTGGLLMGSVGEFAIIIATAAAAILPNAADILSLAFLLTIVTTALMPILFDRKDKIAQLFERFYPIKLQNETRVLQRQVNAVERFGSDPAFQSEFAKSLGVLSKNMVIALSIVYLSYIANFEFGVPFLPFIPKGATPGLLILPLIAWPIYRFITELKKITRQATRSLVFGTFRPSDELMDAAEMEAADVFSGIVLTLVGVGATAFIYYAFPGEFLFLVIPGTYTILAAMYLSKSFYGLIEQYEIMEARMSIGESGVKDKSVLSLASEFDEHAQYFRQLNSERLKTHEAVADALRSNDVRTAKVSLVKFKRKETQALVNLFDFQGMRHFPQLRRMVAKGIERNRQFEHGIPQAKSRVAFEKYLESHLKPHLFENHPESGRRLDAAAQTLIEREMAKNKTNATPAAARKPRKRK